MQDEGKTATIPEERVEKLRLILENIEKRPINVSEAREVGESLLDFYLVLAEEPESESAN